MIRWVLFPLTKKDRHCGGSRDLREDNRFDFREAEIYGDNDNYKTIITIPYM